MKIVILVLCYLLQSVIAQELYAARPNITILETLRTLSPTLYTHIHQDTKFIEILDQIDYNVTFLLPNETALNASISSGALNFSQPTFNILSFLMLNGSHTTKSFLSQGRQFYTTLQPTLPPQPKISIGPLSVNFEPSADKVELFSGLTKARISGTEILCRNGIIQQMDQFLQPAQPPLTTISIMDETEYMEGLLKSLNVSDVISGQNKTILAPISDAWKRAKGSSIPFGTLVQTLKYLVIDGVYTTDDIVSSMRNSKSTVLKSDLKHASVNFTLNAEKKLVVNSKAMVVQSDILTTTGIIHLIDDVFSPDDTNQGPTSNYGADKYSDGDDNPTRASVSPYASDRKPSQATSLTAAMYHLFCIIVLIYLL